MITYVHVKHYLNDEGLRHFDDWFSRVNKFMSKSDGYISLTAEKYPSDNMVYILVKFSSDEQLDTWVKQKIHDDLVDELDFYRTVDYWHAARTTEANADLKNIHYNTIKATNTVSRAGSS